LPLSCCPALRARPSRIGTFSSRGDVPPPAGLADLRKRFEAAVGPIRNTGGVR